MVPSYKNEKNHGQESAPMSSIIPICWAHESSSAHRLRSYPPLKEEQKEEKNTKICGWPLFSRARILRMSRAQATMQIPYMLHEFICMYIYSIVHIHLVYSKLTYNLRAARVLHTDQTACSGGISLWLRCVNSFEIWTGWGEEGVQGAHMCHIYRP